MAAASADVAAGTPLPEIAETEKAVSAGPAPVDVDVLNNKTED